jgi:hypothetical protein
MKERERSRKTLLEAKNIVKVFGSGAYQVKPKKASTSSSTRVS